jgi:hypothetical protein
MAGLGVTPAGVTPAGMGTPTEVAAPPDPASLANYLNPRTGDYGVASDGGIERMPLLRHRVLMLLKTELGSAAPESNIGLRLPAKIDKTFPQRAKEAVRAALEPIPKSEMRIDAIDVLVVGTGRADITVSYTDLTTGNSGTVTI